MPTISDIAKKANVSVSTVSYAINGKRPISEETRKRIFSVMKELGYRPNAIARGLASKRSRIIALLYPDVGAGLGVTALGFFFNTAETARKLGYNVVLWPDVRRGEELNDHLQQGLVDGVVVAEVAIVDERIDLLRRINFPFSMIGRTGDLQGLSYVDIDIEGSIRDTVNYLVRLGHTHIAFINNDKAADDHGYAPSVRSQNSFMETTQAAGIKGLTCVAKRAPNAGYEAFNALMEEDPELTAIITINDYSAPGIAQAIANRGCSIPVDFSIIIGPTSPHMAEIMTPPLTSIDLPIAEMCELGVKLLVQQLEGQEPELTQILIPCHLTVRGSTGPAPRKP